ncbi:MAG: gamma-aminobutyraldehyde dehydrogenase [Ilumatobacteraceae bacterium]|nr:gamma-aminobutyraldehyde dehydrogenase [Ilumatobacteraceae bacterium]
MNERALINPATEAVITTIPDMPLADIDGIVRAAAAAGTAWGTTLPGERASLLHRLADAIEAEADSICALEVEETGKPWTVMRDGELPFALDNLRFFAGAARSVDGTAAGIFSTGYTSMLIRRPAGVVVAITPWNFPLIMAIWKLGAALAAGCTVVLKPAPATPRSSIRIAELALQVGFPPGVLTVVTGDAAVGEALVAHPLTDMITLTGSSGTGRRIMTLAAGKPARLHLELGGKAPLIVFADADPVAVGQAAALAASYSSGQDCTAATRVYVERSAHDTVVAALAETMRGVTLGGPYDGTDIGPLITSAHRNRVHGFVERARAAGATVACGGAVPDRPGWFYPPTLITGVEQSSEIVRDEVFGPVLAVLPFDTEDEAVALANDTQYGLASSVWTPQVDRALRVAHRLKVGVTWINDHLPIASEMPHGGRGASGFGKDMGHDSIDDFSVAHHVMIKHAEPTAREGFRPA